MNIFSLDTCAIKSAQFLCDKHMKMLLESAQLLCTTFWMQDIEAPYRKTHYNHPSAIWARQSKGNFNWLLNHAIAIGKEYTFRYNKRHKSEDVIDWVADNQDKLKFDKNEQTEFAIAISPEQKCRKHPNFDDLSPVEKYRLYYIYDKASFCTWKNRSVPEWFSLDLIKN
jgi:hypothetical protein